MRYFAKSYIWPKSYCDLGHHDVPIRICLSYVASPIKFVCQQIFMKTDFKRQKMCISDAVEHS